MWTKGLFSWSPSLFSSLPGLQFPRIALINYYQPTGLIDNRNLFSHNSGSQKSEIKESARLVPSAIILFPENVAILPLKSFLFCRLCGRKFPTPFSQSLVVTQNPPAFLDSTHIPLISASICISLSSLPFCVLFVPETEGHYHWVLD